MVLSAVQHESLALLMSYIDLGWAVLPIWGVRNGHCACSEGVNCKKSPGKHPNAKLAPNGLKNATRDKSVLREWFKRYPDGNWAVRCGEPLVGGGFSLFLDVDPRNGGDETLASIQGLRGELPDTVEQDSGGNGKHYGFVSDEPVHDKSIGPGLDVQGAGKYILVEPSRHISGGAYVWTIGRRPDDMAVARAPAWLLEQASTGTGARPPRIGDGSARDTILGEAFALAGMLGVGFADGNVAVTCPWVKEHSDTRGTGTDSSTVILPPAGGSNFGGFSCKHSHCATRKWQDVLAALPPHAVAEAHRKYPPKLQVVSNMTVTEAEAPSTAASAGDPLDDVRKRLSYKAAKGGGFKVEADLVNAVTLLSYDHRWKDVLKLDEFSQVLRIMKAPPWHADDSAREVTEGAAWTDLDTTRLHLWFKRYWALDLSIEKCQQAAYTVACNRGFHPLKNYLNDLVWDGVPRLATWTNSYLGAKDTPYNRKVGTWWMNSGAARGLEPGTKVDYLVIFEGPQGTGKSTALGALVPDSTWFSDTPIDLNSKDSYTSLRGKFILELGELSSLSKADTDRAKNFFSSSVDSYRPPYGRENVNIPRSCIFAGTVNHNEYLKDATGNRRYWPIETGVFDIEGLIRDRDQLWAEAAHNFKEWVKRGRNKSECLWYPRPEDAAMIENEQKDREFDDGWIEDIAKWTKTDACKRLLAEYGGVTTAMVLKGALNREAGEIERGSMDRVEKVLRRGLAWKKERRQLAGSKAWMFMPREGT